MVESDNCENFNNITINIINVIYIIIFITLIYILVLNVLNYLLFTIYCMKDISDEYTSEDSNRKSQDRYKYRLFNYIKNFNKETYSYNIKYDDNSSDLYIHNINAYFNFIVKLLLLVGIFLLIGIAYNIYISLLNNVHDTGCPDDAPANICTFILYKIYKDHMHIFYLSIIIFACIFIHSFIYTYIFHDITYNELYTIYIDQFLMADNIVKKEINNLNQHCNKAGMEDQNSIEYTNTSKFTDQLMDFSFNKLELSKFIINKPYDETIPGNNFQKLIEEGLSYNSKFIIPSTNTDINDINDLLKIIYNNKMFSVPPENIIAIINTLGSTEKTTLDATNIVVGSNKTLLETEKGKYDSASEIIAGQINIYLVYHLVISHNMDDPFIIHKLNNILFNIFENIKKKYKEQQQDVQGENPPAAAPSAKETADKAADKVALEALKANPDNKKLITDRAEAIYDSSYTSPKKSEEDADKIIETLNYDIKKMYREIICSHSIKLLLPPNPVNITKDYIETELKNNKKLILDYIENYINIRNKVTTGNNELVAEHYTVVKYITTKIADNSALTPFVDTFVNYTSELQILEKMSKVVYTLNTYIGLDILTTSGFILIILYILYDVVSRKFPSLKIHIINIIKYMLIIFSELASSFFGLAI